MSFSGDFSYAELRPLKDDVKPVTVCLRYLTKNNHEQRLFSLASTSDSKALWLSREEGVYKVGVGSDWMPFRDMPADKMGDWNSACVVWNTDAGMIQLWVNEVRTLRKVVPIPDKTSGSLSSKISLGKIRPYYEWETPGTSRYIPFEGDMKDIHMWDQVLSPCEIKKYINHKEGGDLAFTPGNIINWKALDFTTEGTVSIK